MCYFPFMPRQALPVNLTETDHQELERWVAAHRTPQQVWERCRIVLAAAQGRQDKLIADDLDVNFKTVALWRRRFISEGPDKTVLRLRSEVPSSRKGELKPRATPSSWTFLPASCGSRCAISSPVPRRGAGPRGEPPSRSHEGSTDAWS